MFRSPQFGPQCRRGTYVGHAGTSLPLPAMVPAPHRHAPRPSPPLLPPTALPHDGGVDGEHPLPPDARHVHARLRPGAWFHRLHHHLCQWHRHPHADHLWRQVRTEMGVVG